MCLALHQRDPDKDVNYGNLMWLGRYHSPTHTPLGFQGAWVVQSCGDSICFLDLETGSFLQVIGPSSTETNEAGPEAAPLSEFPNDFVPINVWKPVLERKAELGIH